jgi:HK97 family phage portal protein
MAPARDVVHLRQYTPRHPLIGESPIKAAALALGVNVALSGNQAAFYSNMNRPSGVLSTDQILTRDQMTMLREAFDAQAQGMNAGKIPVLAGGLKFSAMGMTSQDSQLVEAQRMSIEEVARCYGTPLPVVGDLSKATMSNVEAMINFWLATGLGSLLENLERSFDAGFNLPASEYIEFDERSLLRMDYQQRITAITKAIQGGVMSPNEARASEGLPPVDGGNDVFMQQQMVSIDLLGELHAADIAAKNKPPPAPAAPAEADPPAADDEPPPPADDKQAEGDGEIAKALVIQLRDRKRRAA